jgi:hypothetical protein
LAIGCSIGWGSFNVHYTLVERHARSQTEQQQRDDEAPEVEFAAMSEWVVLVRRQISAVLSVEQERSVACIDKRVLGQW